MALEHKLAEGVRRHAERMKEHEKDRGSKEKEPRSGAESVSIRKMDNGHHSVTANYGEGDMEETGHSSIGKAFRHAKGCMGVDSDEGEMKE